MSIKTFSVLFMPETLTHASVSACPSQADLLTLCTGATTEGCLVRLRGGVDCWQHMTDDTPLHSRVLLQVQQLWQDCMRVSSMPGRMCENATSVRLKTKVTEPLAPPCRETATSCCGWHAIQPIRMPLRGAQSHGAERCTFCTSSRAKSMLLSRVCFR